MSDKNQIESIKERLKTNAYFLNPHSDVHAAKDIQYLLSELETAQKKNEVLSQHVMELTQEMENVKSDFGNNR